MALVLGVDTGGTFTDFVLWDGTGLRVHKVLSTPDAPERAILQGVRALGLDPAGLRMVHGSTVATNAALEGKGVRTAFVTNRGFADLLTIGRQHRADLYDLQPPPEAPPVPAALCLETGGRLAADGSVVEPLSEVDLTELRARLAALKPDAVAVNLLFSFLDNRAERAIAEVVPEGVFTSLSSQVLPELREVERGMATWLNAWVGPLVQGYLRRLAQGLPGTRLSVMQSAGDTVAAEQAGEQAVRMLLSGPAGGLVGARFVGQTAGCPRLLTFDMGGTSTDVALIDGEPRLTTEGRIGRYPVAVPMVDMHTIGAGGGSVGWLDAGSMLQVGPESAGADPGPACYGRGGRRPTVTDANLVLGRLRGDAFLGGSMALDSGAARAALATLAEPLGCSVEAAAEGVLRVANEHMARALRTISVQRGIDPGGFVLTCFGGAGGLHVCDLAESLGLVEALVPVHGGVLSALGMLAARPGRQLSRTWQGLLDDRSDQALEEAFVGGAEQGRSALAAEGLAETDMQLSPSLDLRYQGQAYTLNVPWQGVAAAKADFHRSHRARYGHALRAPVELVNLRLAVRGPGLAPGLQAPTVGRDETPAPAPRDGVAHLPRSQLAVGQVVQGPAVITEPVATTWLAAGWQASKDDAGNLRLRRVS